MTAMISSSFGGSAGVAQPLFPGAWPAWNPGQVAGDRWRAARSSRSSDMNPPRARETSPTFRASRRAANRARPVRYRFRHRAALRADPPRVSRLPRTSTAIGQRRAIAHRWVSSDSAASGRVKRCARTAPLPMSRSLPLRAWSSSFAGVQGLIAETPRSHAEAVEHDLAHDHGLVGLALCLAAGCAGRACRRRRTRCSPRRCGRRDRPA
jgi:hypothetical protein